MKSTVSFVVVATAVSACSPSKSGNSISCDVPTQNICYEDESPTTAQLQNLPVKCSSVSGTYATPAACPQAGYVGKCTFAAPDGTETDRFYTGTDVTYQQDFCVNTALGVWSTAF